MFNQLKNICTTRMSLILKLKLQQGKTNVLPTIHYTGDHALCTSGTIRYAVFPCETTFAQLFANTFFRVRTVFTLPYGGIRTLFSRVEWKMIYVFSHLNQIISNWDASLVIDVSDVTSFREEIMIPKLFFTFYPTTCAITFVIVVL